MKRTIRIAHLSDLHFGRIAHPDVVDALVAEIDSGAFDLVAVSGDLTQRARPGEYREARAFVERLPGRVLVVPGNHDVYPWWHPVLRVRDPLRRFREFITADPRPTIELPGVRVFGLNSAFGMTVKGGRIESADRAAMSDFFDAGAPSDFRILVVHHHLTKLEALGRHDVARYARATLDAAVTGRVDMILCGHLHISHIEPVEIVPARHRLVVVSAGTATSDRGRKQHRRTNFYNHITIEPDAFVVEERVFQPESRTFRSECETHFDRG